MATTPATILPKPSPEQVAKPIDFSAINFGNVNVPVSAPTPTPVKENVAGIGTITRIPKAPIAGTPAPTTPPDDNIAGAYARAGLTPPTTPPPAGTANGYVAPSVPGLPSYPSSDSYDTSKSTITDAYNTLLKSITSIEDKIKSNSLPSAEEQQLGKDLADKKAALANFDIATLQQSEDLYGQGRGRTLSNIQIEDTKNARTRALQRLGLATEAQTISDQLALAQTNRKAAQDSATTEYNLAGKRLDIALGLQKEISSLNEKEQDNARQFLLDTVSFADGKTYEQLDAATQAAITHAVAHSPITLDMVKTSLKSGAEKAAAAAAGQIREITGLGTVMIKPDGSYKVIIPKFADDGNPPTSNVNAPSFVDFVASKGFPIGMATPAKLDALREEYNTKYASGSVVSLGKLTPTNKNDIKQAGLSGAPAPVQSYFLNAPAEFRDQYQRDIAAGKAPARSVDEINAAYTAWYNAKQSAKGGTRDWAAILGTKK